MSGRWLAVVALVVTSACANASKTPPPVSPAKMAKVDPPDAPWRREATSTGWEPKIDAPKILIRGARVLIGDGREISNGHVLMEGGKIVAVGDGDGDPTGAELVDAKGKVVTPGLIDTHSHLGVYPMPRAAAHSDGNEITAPNTAEVRAIDAFWPNDPGIPRALAGGTTTIQALPGSANLIGGRGVTLKLRKATSSRAMHFSGALDGLKMACGENPKRVYGRQKRAPSTRMGNLAGQRAAFLKARRLIRDWDEWRTGEADRVNAFAEARADHAAKSQQRTERETWCAETNAPTADTKCKKWQKSWEKEPLDAPTLEPGKPPPARNLATETLAAAIEGKVLVHVHCYRSDDMVNMMALADEMGFRIRSFHHALEAYKVRAELARRKIAVSTWADWWGFKLEAYDGIRENAALVEAAGGMPVIHSDSKEGIRRLNQEAAKAFYFGQNSGVALKPGTWIRWVTKNPAWALGIEDRVGTIEVGKDADVVIWSGDPMSVYTSAERVYVDGLERHHGESRKPWSDFEAAP